MHSREARPGRDRVSNGVDTKGEDVVRYGDESVYACEHGEVRVSVSGEGSAAVEEFIEFFGLSYERCHDEG